MTSAVQPSPVSLTPSYELGLSSLGPGEASSSIPRNLSHRPVSKSVREITQALATPPINSYGVIVSLANGDPKERYLRGVKEDLPFVLGELGERTTGALHVVTDSDLPDHSYTDRTRVLPPTAQSVESAIKEVKQVLKPGDLCWVYLAGHTTPNAGGTVFMPLPNEESLCSNDLASWLKDAASGGGTIIVIVDVCHALAFLGMPTVYNVNKEGSLLFSNNEPSSPKGQVIIFSPTVLGELARTIQVKEGENMVFHGFFTWVLFEYLREQPLEVDIGKLLLHLRQQSAWRDDLSPQLSATIEGLRHLPIGLPSARLSLT